MSSNPKLFYSLYTKIFTSKTVPAMSNADIQVLALKKNTHEKRFKKTNSKKQIVKQYASFLEKKFQT